MRATTELLALLAVGVSGTIGPSLARAQTALDLPPPLYLETFDTVEEGKLPAGWTAKNYSDPTVHTNFDLGNLNSAAYADWVVVDSARFQGPLLTYDTGDADTAYRRVLDYGGNYQVNGVTVTSLAQGRILFGNSGFRSGRSQFLVVTTADYDLAQHSDIHVAFHSLYEQNQDSLGALEYSVDGGAHWLPALYLIDEFDVLTGGTGEIDAVATFNEPHSYVAYVRDPVTGQTFGGTYGAFIAAPIGTNLAASIRGRVSDDTFDSKRIELIRLPQADRQARVRFRFAYAGTDSWYFGVDNFGLYSLTPGTPPTIASQPQSRTVLVGESVTFSVQVSGDAPTYQWQFGGQAIVGATNASLTLTNVQPAQAGTYTVRVANRGGHVTSAPATLTVQPVSADPPRLDLLSFSGNTVTVTWTGGRGPFQLQKTATLVAPNWQNVGGVVTARQMTDTRGTNAAFYRVFDQAQGSGGGAAKLAPPTIAGTTLTLTWTGGTAPFQVQVSTNLVNPGWQNLGTPTSERAFSQSVSGKLGFFRVVGQ